MAETVQPHILVVDDDPQIRDLLKEYLTQNELRVSVASSGRDMSAILVEHAIDLVILDLRLAGEDGMTLARKLREESSIPVIILSGIRDEADRIMGLELGADDYLTKPFSPRELLARIRTVLRRTKGAALAEARQGDIRAYRFGRIRTQPAYAAADETPRKAAGTHQRGIQFTRRLAGRPATHPYP